MTQQAMIWGTDCITKNKITVVHDVHATKYDTNISLLRDEIYITWASQSPLPHLVVSYHFCHLMMHEQKAPRCQYQPPEKLIMYVIIYCTALQKDLQIKTRWHQLFLVQF